ncbi:MAG: hypothetical protein IT393_07175 [Nitrospirae bacterium]|nr:hypothetical protein [Nitrospirota bacterium]
MTAKEWNEKYTVGMRVIYTPVMGRPKKIETVATSKAWELRDQTPVIKIAGIIGGVALSHVEIING